MKKTLFLTSIFVFASLFFLVNNTSAATLNVGPSETHTSITSALNSANPGDVINISSGTYNESLLINKNLTLVGNGEKPVISGSGANYIIKIEGSGGVVLDNLEINGLGSAVEPNAYEYGVFVNNAGTQNNPVEIKNSIIKNIWGASGNAVGVESSSYVLMHNNILSTFQKNGVRFVGSEGKFYANTVRGDVVDGISRVQNLINLRSNSNVEIYNNTITNGLTSSPSSDTLFSPCIFVNAYPDGVASRASIYNNDISFCDVGVIITTKLIAGDSSSATISNNNFHDLYLGISFQQETGSGTISDNSFTNVIKTSNRTIENKPIVQEVVEVVQEKPPVKAENTEEVVVEESSVTPEVLEETPATEDPFILIEEPPVLQVEESALAASVGSMMTFGTRNNILGILGAFFILILVVYLSKKYHKE